MNQREALCEDGVDDRSQQAPEVPSVSSIVGEEGIIQQDSRENKTTH